MTDAKNVSNILDTVMNELKNMREEFDLQMGKYEQINELENRVDELEKRVNKIEETKS